MLQSRVFSQLIRRAQAKPRSSSHLVVIASGLLAALLTSCGSSGRASAPPVRELVPAADSAVPGEAIVVGEATAEQAVDELLEISASDCRTTFNPKLVQSDQEQQGPVQLVLDAVEVAQDDDERCGHRSTEEVYCRALWLLEVLDPVAIAFDPLVSPDERLEAAASLDWALTTVVDAPVVAEDGSGLEGSVGNAFAQLRPLSAELAQALEGVDATSQLNAEHEERLALLIRARAHPTILEPLSAMQTACMLGG